MSAEKMVPISGNTYPVKDAIKALGGRWNGDRKVWMVPAEKADEARRLVAGAPQSTPRKSGGQRFGRYGGKRQGQCWECGAVGPLDQDGMCGNC